MPHTWYNSAEVADYLHVPESDVEAWARHGEIPCVRRGDRFAFRKRDVELWASCHLLGGGASPLSKFHERDTRAQEPAAPALVLSPLLTCERIAPALESRTRASVIRDMVDFAQRTGLLNYPDDLRCAIEAREAETSTALSGGVALLHPGHREPYLVEESFILLGRTVQDIPFGAPDGKPTRLFFLLCCDDHRLHLQALARLCRICYHTTVLTDLLAAPTSEAMCELIRNAEATVLSERRVRGVA